MTKTRRRIIIVVLIGIVVVVWAVAWFIASRTPNDNAHKVYDALQDAGYTDIQAAGIVGALSGQTSNIDPTAHQREADPDWGGYGIAMWTATSRDRLEQYAASQNRDPGELGVQTEFLITDLAQQPVGDGRTAADLIQGIWPTDDSDEATHYAVEAVVVGISQAYFRDPPSVTLGHLDAQTDYALALLS